MEKYNLIIVILFIVKNIQQLL